MMRLFFLLLVCNKINFFSIKGVFNADLSHLFLFFWQGIFRLVCNRNVKFMIWGCFLCDNAAKSLGKGINLWVSR